MTTTTELLLGANSHLFDSERALYPDDDLATTVWTPRAFSASDSMVVMEAGGLDCALSATAEQSEPRTPFAWGDYERTLREGETQVRVWVEDGDAQAQEEAEYTCRPEATPRAPPSPIRDYAVADPPAPAVEEAEAAPAEAMEAEAEAAPVAEAAPPKQPKKVRVYFSGRRMWGGAVPPKRALRAAKKLGLA